MDQTILESDSVSNMEDIRDLTPMQAGILYQCMAENEPGQFCLHQISINVGGIDENTLKAALFALVYRHEVLRTAFIIPKHSGKPQQVVMREREIELNCLDFSDRSDEEYSTLLNKTQRDDAARGFDLENDSLMRVTLLRKPGGNADLLWGFHHIIVDNRSLQCLSADFARYYARLDSGDTMQNILRDVEMEINGAASFGDYVQLLANRDKTAASAYWRKLLYGYGVAADIAPMELASEEAEVLAKAVECTLSETDSENTLRVVESAGVDVSDLLEAAWGLVLQKYNDSTDVVFGKVVNGRQIEMPNIENAVGLFTNTIPVRVKCEPGQTALDLLLFVRRQREETAAHAFVGLTDIHRVSELGGNLLQTILTFENDAAYFGETPFFPEQINYPVSVKAYYNNNRLAFSILYDPRVYSREEALLIRGRMEMAIRVFSESLSQQTDKIDLIGQEEQLYTLIGFNEPETQADSAITIVDLLEQWAELKPSQICATFGGESITYAEYNERCNQIAHKLRAMGARPDAFVALFTPRSLEMLVAIGGILKSGAAFVPIDPYASIENILHILNECAPVAVVTAGSDLPAQIPNLYSVLDMFADTDAGNNSLNPIHLNRPVDLACCLYIADEMSIPKAALLEHQSLMDTSAGLLLNNKRNTHFLSHTGYCYDLFLLEFFGALLGGGSLTLTGHKQSKDASALIEYIDETKPNAACFTPSQLKTLLETKENKSWLADFQTLFIGGEAFPGDLYHTLRGCTDAAIYGLYGSAETAVIAVISKIQNDAPDLGRPVANKRVYILDGRKPCGIGEPGEICVAGRGLARGYLHHEALTDKRFIKNPFGAGKLYRTGDYARWKSNGSIDYLGRLDEQVKSYGMRIDLPEIEAAIRRQDGIADAIAAVRPDAFGNQAIFAWYVAKQPSTDEKQALDVGILRTNLALSLPFYWMPLALMQIPAIPVRADGKADTALLPEIRTESRGRKITARNPAEERVADVFAEILHIHEIGVDDDFFAIGGDSIQALQIVSKLAANGAIIPVKEIFALRTVANIARKYPTCGTFYRPWTPEEPAESEEAIRSSTRRQKTAYRKALMDGHFRASDSLSPSQCLSWRVGASTSFAVIRVDEVWSAERFAFVWMDILREFDVLRSSIKMHPDGETGVMLEYGMEAIRHIPFADISGFENQEQILDKIIDEMPDYNDRQRYNGQESCHFLMCVKRNERRFDVLIAASRMIFDDFSQEVLTGRLRNLYAGSPSQAAKRYSDFGEYICQGPQNISQQDLMRGLELTRFTMALSRYRTKNSQEPRKRVDYTRVLHVGANDLMSIINRVLQESLRFTWGDTQVPLLLAYSGRNYPDGNFSDQIGEFMDLCPLVVDTRLDTDIMGKAEKQIHFIREHRISVAALLFDRNLSGLYPLAMRMLIDIKDSWREIQTLNLLSLYNDSAAAPIKKRDEENALQINFTDNKLNFHNLLCPADAETEFVRHLDRLFDDMELESERR